jgi:hypothetical protein
MQQLVESHSKGGFVATSHGQSVTLPSLAGLEAAHLDRRTTTQRQRQLQQRVISQASGSQALRVVLQQPAGTLQALLLCWHPCSDLQ